jgi:membrane protease YdiL (CAAX protease family)
MNSRTVNRHLFLKALLCSLALMAFSFFIHYKFPVRLISFAALLIPAIIFAGSIKSLPDLKKITGEIVLKRTNLFYLFAGIMMGISFAVIYRWHLNISLLPKSIFLFSLVAALIGSLEELVFRGFIQEYVKNINGIFSVFFSSLSHTGYKCCLFLSPVLIIHTDIWFLASWTFTAGLLSGTLRHFSKSLLPSVAAHALFDIVVYAEFVSAPWWVW